METHPNSPVSDFIVRPSRLSSEPVTLRRAVPTLGRRPLVSVLALLLAVFAAPFAHAKLPEPDSIYFGAVTHAGGTPLVATSSGQFAVIARLNGVEIARTSITPGTNKYVLKVPMDDGLEPRLLGTARPSERVRIYAQNTATGVEAEVTESTLTTGNRFILDNQRGVVTSQSLSTSVTLFAPETLAARYASWKSAYAPALNPAADDSLLDADSDGFNNLAEFIASTDPTLAGSVLSIREMRVANGVVSLRFGPVALSRRYLLDSTSSLSQPWVEIGTYRFNAAAPDAWVDILKPTTPAFFYRVRVELE